MKAELLHKKGTTSDEQSFRIIRICLIMFLLCVVVCLFFRCFGLSPIQQWFDSNKM